MQNQPIIEINDVSKVYKIYSKPQHRFYSSINRIINLKNDKYYKEYWALNSISLEINRGETIGIIGRNGSGKSTLLQIIAKVLTANFGQITTRGRIAALLELGAGFNPEYTGRENIITNGTVLGISQKEISEKMEDIIEFSELTAFIDRPIKTYSSGMYVRLAFSIAIHTNPDILIIDEALAVGDEAFQRKCFSKIRSFQDSGGTILFVSHNSSLVMDLCTRALLLDRGKMILVGSPKKVVTCYQKLIYAGKDNESRIISEISKDSLQLDETNTINGKEVKNKITENYDSSLKPTSTIHYKHNGVFISDATIKTLENEMVNILIPRNEYIFSYNVRFSDEVHKVRFGMLLKTITGLELGGATNTKFSKAIDSISKDSTVVVEFKFKCLLSSGTYFLNAGVTSCLNGTESFLARTIDILMFKVHVMNELYTTGTVDFLISSNINMISTD